MSIEDHDAAELRGQVEVLREENRRLRREYARARQSRYRRTAAGFVGLGLVALAGAALFPVARTVLIALGGVGLFAGLTTYYLTPEQFVAASVGERVYAAYADSAASAVADLGLAADRVYVPTGETDGARLFVPQATAYEIPDEAALGQAFVVGDDGSERGATVRPTGQPLFAEFRRALAGDLATEPATAADQLADGLVEQFELAETVRPDDSEPGRLTVGVDGSAYGDLDRFDHPVPSFLAVGLARALDRPVTASVTGGDDRTAFLVTLRWDAGAE